MESPAALSNLPETLSRPGALDALIFFNTLINFARKRLLQESHTARSRNQMAVYFLQVVVLSYRKSY